MELIIKKMLLILAAAGICVIHLYAQNSSSQPQPEIILAPSPVIKLSNSISNIIWSNDSSLFAFSEDSNLIIADGKNNAISEMIHTKGTIRQIQIARTQTNDNEQMLILSGNNSVMIHALREGAKSVFTNHTNAQVTGIAFSNTGKYTAMGLSNGDIALSMQLMYSGELSTRRVTGHNTGPYTMVFSPNSQYLASGADDGFVRVIRTEDLKVVAKEPFANAVHAPISFTTDSKSVFFAAGPNVVTRIAVTGATWMTENKEYTTAVPLVQFEEVPATPAINSSSSLLAVLTQDQQFIWFDTETQEELGFIPRLSKSTIVDFAFSVDGSELLLGYTDGSILRIICADYYRSKGASVEVRFEEYFESDGTGGTGVTYTANDENGLVPFGYMLPPNAVFDFLDFTAGFEKLGTNKKTTMPYTIGIMLDVRISHSLDFTTIPFYMGIGLRSSFAFPNQNYPFTYRDQKGNVLAAPYLVSLQTPLHFGYQIRLAPATFIFFQIMAGPGGNILWAPGIANSGIHFSFTAGGSLGFQWNGFRIFFEPMYDTTTNLTFSTGLSFRLSLHERDS